MTRVLVISVEPPWPPNHGGRLRIARLAEALSRDLDVVVTYPERGASATAPAVRCRPLPWHPVPAFRSRGTIRPHLGGHHLLPALTSLVALCRELRPDAVYWSHSYLAAWCPRELRSIPSVVEFVDIECDRLRSLAASAKGARRIARSVEAAKARVWEPAVARGAAVCVALSEPDYRMLRGWHANAVLVPNGVDRLPYAPSPADGYALAMASYEYEPNVIAARWLVRDVWPLVRARLPRARLVVAGWGSEALTAELEAIDGVTVGGTVADVTETYAGAAVALAPATTGGGSQLKLTESLSRGRCVVLSPFAAGGLPAAIRGSEACRVAANAGEFADAIADAVENVKVRHIHERAGWLSTQGLAWPQTVAPVAEAIARMMAVRERR